MLYNVIRSHIKSAMMSHDTLMRDVLRLVMNKAHALMKEANPQYDGIDLIPDDIMIRAIKQELKQLTQTMDALQSRPDTSMYAETLDKITILSGFMPKMMTPEEVDRAVFNVLTDNYYPSFGEKMKAVMAQLRGKADNKDIKAAVEKYR